jgi:hypothetical protein
VDRYFPHAPEPAAPLPSAARDAKTVSGYYLVSRRSETNFFRLASLITEMKVSPGPDGTIETDQILGYGHEPKRWEEIGPLSYRETHGQDRIAFRRNAGGRLELVISFPVMIFTRASGLENQAFLMPALIASVAVVALTLLLWPIGALVRRHYRRDLALARADLRWRLWTRLVCAIDVALVARYAGVIAMGVKDITFFTAAHDPWLRVLQALSILAVLGSLVALFNAFRAWSRPGRGVWSRVGETLIAVACLGLVWIIFVGRLLHVGPVY